MSFDAVVEDTREAPRLRGYPLVGVVPQLFRDPVGFCQQAVRTHGDFVGMKLGPTDAYLVCHPAHVKGAGPHQCVGNAFATMQAQFILAASLSRFRFELAGPVRAKAVHVTLRPHPALLMRIARR